MLWRLLVGVCIQNYPKLHKKTKALTLTAAEKLDPEVPVVRKSPHIRLSQTTWPYLEYLPLPHMTKIQKIFFYFQSVRICSLIYKFNMLLFKCVYLHTIFHTAIRFGNTLSFSHSYLKVFKYLLTMLLGRYIIYINSFNKVYRINSNLSFKSKWLVFNQFI